MMIRLKNWFVRIGLAAVLMLALVLTVMPVTGYAAGATASISVDKTELGTGDTVTIKVTIKGNGQNLGKLSFQLLYDANILELKDSQGNNFNGKLPWGSGTVGADTYVETFTATALAEGTATISFSAAPIVYSETDESTQIECSIEKNDVAVWVNGAGSSQAQGSSAEVPPSSSSEGPSSEAPSTEASQEMPAQAGSCDLSELTITPGEITFDPDVTEYTIQVANDVTRVAVSAKTAQEDAGYVVEGYENLAEGENLVTVHVTSPDGASKDYLIHVIRLNEAGEVPEATDEENGTEKSEVKGFQWECPERTFYVTTFPSGVAIPKGYTYSSVVIGSYEVPAYVSGENSGLYLVYAQEEGQDPGLCWYRVSDGQMFPCVAVQAAGNGEELSLPVMLLIGAGIIVLIALMITVIVTVVRNREGRVRFGFENDDEELETEELQDREDASEEDWESQDQDEEYQDDFQDEDDYEDDDDEEEEDDQEADSATASSFGGSKDFPAEPIPEEEPEKDELEEFGIDIQLMQAGIEKEAGVYGASAGISTPGGRTKPERPKKPVMNSRRLNAATTRIDSDQIKQNREHQGK